MPTADGASASHHQRRAPSRSYHCANASVKAGVTDAPRHEARSRTSAGRSAGPARRTSARGGGAVTRSSLAGAVEGRPCAGAVVQTGVHPLRLAVSTFLLGTALQALPAAAPASAATDQPGCFARLSAAPNGDVYAAGSCSGDVVTVSRRAASAASFRAVATAWKGFAVRDVADDGASTFVLLHCDGIGGTCRAADPLVGRFAVAKLPHGGRPSAVTLLGDGQGDGSLAAADGRWVAAYAAAEFRREESERAYSRIEVRGTAVGGARATILPRQPEATPEPFVSQPAVVLRPDGAYVVYVDSRRESDPAPELRTASVTRAGRVTTAAFAPAAGAAADTPAVAASGGHTFVGWSRASRPALAVDGVRHDLPSRGQVRGSAWRPPADGSSTPTRSCSPPRARPPAGSTCARCAWTRRAAPSSCPRTPRAETRTCGRVSGT